MKLPVDLIIFYIIPFTFIFPVFPFINHLLIFRKYSIFDKLLFSTAFTVTFITISLSLWGSLFPGGFISFSKIIFILCLFLTVYSLIILYKNNNFIQSIYKLFQKNNFFYIYFFILVYLTIFIIKPVIDSDTIESYLPMARSIIIYDSIPSYNYYDNNPFIVPPIGGPVLFAYFYAISGNMITEAFKLINLPFFLGFVYLSYKLFRRHFNYKISLLGAVILLTMPIIEDTVFTASLYPDLIFAFLALYSFEILFENIDIVSKKRNLYFVFFGLLNITMMYLKYQALFIWLLNFIYILKARLNKQWIVTGVIFIPFLLRFVLDKKSDLLNIYNIFLFIITFCLTFFIQKNTNKKFYITKINILVILFLLIIGMFPIIRNYYLYGGFEDYTKHYNWINEIQIKSIIKLKTESTIFNHLFDIFINPKISLVYVIPMILGLITSFLDKKKHAITYIFLIYYFWWLIFLKGETIRWLLPIIPIITFYILVGLKYIFKQYKSIEKYILCSTIFLLLSSKMIIWTLASDYIGTQNIRKYYLGDMDSFSNIINPLNKSSFSNYIFNETVNFIYALSSRTEITKYQFKYLFLYIIFTFLFSTILIQKKYIRNKLLYIIPVVSVYCLFFIKIFHYNYVNSSDFIADKLFNYWGQSQFIVPYIRDNSTNNDVTLLFSDPTGMAYFTNSKVLNMYYGYGIGFFKGIFYQRNIQEIYEFYKKNNIKFVAILNYGVNTEKFKNLKKNTEIFDIIENNKYFKIVKFPDNDNYWYLYEII